MESAADDQRSSPRDVNRTRAGDPQDKRWQALHPKSSPDPLPRRTHTQPLAAARPRRGWPSCGPASRWRLAPSRPSLPSFESGSQLPPTSGLGHRTLPARRERPPSTR